MALRFALLAMYSALCVPSQLRVYGLRIDSPTRSCVPFGAATARSREDLAIAARLEHAVDDHRLVGGEGAEAVHLRN
jgi:hypothetical protein